MGDEREKQRGLLIDDAELANLRGVELERTKADLIRSHQMVADMKTVLTTTLYEHKLMLENLTATQQRCTELLEENRALKAALEATAKLTQPDTLFDPGSQPRPDRMTEILRRDFLGRRAPKNR